MIELPEDVELKMAWARVRLAELSEACLAYVQSRPVALRPVRPDVEERDGWVAWAVESVVTVPPPSEISLIACDVVQNARAALDYLARALVLTSGGRPKDGPGGTQFPILAAPPARSLSIAGCASAEISGQAVAVQPYLDQEPGRHPLARLNELNNLGKHQMLPLTVAAAAIPAVIAIHSTGETPIGVVSPFMRWFFDHDQLDPILALLPQDAAPVIRGDFEATVTLEGDAWQTVNIIEDLAYMLDYITHRVLPSFRDYFDGAWPDMFHPRDVPNSHASLPRFPMQALKQMIREMHASVVGNGNGKGVMVMGLVPEMSCAKGYSSGGAPLSGHPPR